MKKTFHISNLKNLQILDSSTCFFKCPTGEVNSKKYICVECQNVQGGHVTKMTCLAATIAVPSQGSESDEEQGEKSLNS